MSWTTRLLRQAVTPRRPVRRSKLRVESLEARDVPAVTGIVFRDVDGNGLRGAGDTRLSGVVVQLLTGEEVVNTVTTGANGTYTFGGIQAETDYQVRINSTQASLTGLAATLPDEGDDDALDSDFIDFEGAATIDFTTETAADALAFDAGFAPLPELTLGGRVVNDADNSGTLDEGETGVAGVTVQLLGETSDAVQATATTGADGKYQFTGLANGTFRVRLAASNFSASGPLAGLDPSTDANPDPDDDVAGDSNGEASGTLGSGGFVVSGPIVLSADEEPVDEDEDANTNLNLDFGLTGESTDVETGASLSGRVFLDYDNSGAVNGPDTGVAGVTVTLSGGGLTTPRTAQTTADGSFTFTDLEAGTYTLTETQPTTPTNQNGKTTAGTAGGATTTTNVVNNIVLAADAAAIGYIFAEVPRVSTGGTVFNDQNGNGRLDTGEPGVPGVTLTLSGADVVSAAPITPVTATTNASGVYTFTGLTPGTYSIAQTQPTGFTDGAEQNGTPTGTVGSDTFTGINLTTAATSGGFNFGETSATNPTPGTASLAGAVFVDANGDGNRQPAEAGVAGVTIRLTGTAVDRTATTGADGSFSFAGLAAGTYSLAETQPTGRPDGTDKAGTAGGSAATNDTITGIVLAANQTATGYLFGEGVPTSTGGDEEGDLRTAMALSAGVVQAGGLVTITSVVRNRGTGDASGAEATVNLGGLQFVSASSDDFDPETRTWDVGDLEAGEAATLRVVARVPARGTFTPTIRVPAGTDGAAATTMRVASATVMAGGGGMPRFWFLSSSWIGGAAVRPPVAVAPVSPPVTPNPPATPTLALAAASDTGTAGDRSTGLAAVTLTGTTTPRAAVRLLETNATTTADATGAFSFANVPLTTGSNTLTVRAATAGGRTTGTTTITRVGDSTTAPATPTLALAAASDTGTAGDNTTDLASVTLTGTTTAGAGVTLVETGATATAGATGAFTFTSVPLVAGSNAFTVRATNGGGTSTGTATFTRTTTTTTAPTTPTFGLAALSDTGTAGDNTTDLATVSLTGTTTAGAAVTLMQTNATATADAAGAFMFRTVPLVAGPNTFTVRATNSGGTTTGTATITRTTTNTTAPTTPTLGLAAASDTGTVGDRSTDLATVTLTGTTTAGASVKLVETDATVTADAAGAFTFTAVPLTVGANTFTAQATTAGGTSSGTATITRVVGATTNAAPTLAEPLAAVSVVADNTTVVDLAGTFDDANITNTLLTIDTSEGPVNVELFDRQAPKTVANFLNYVESGAYTDSIFHRSASLPNGTPFVLQGGGFTFEAGVTPSIANIPTDPPVQNEPDAVNRSNLKGTLAMAKQGGNPNSATNQFFVNLGNNSANLDNQNGGFTVFGKLAAPGDQAVVDTLSKLPTQDQGSAADLPVTQQGVFTDIPLKGYTGTDFPTDTSRANYALINEVTITRQTEELTYTVVGNTNPDAATATVNDNRLTIRGVAAGQTTLTIRATDRAGATAETTVTVTVA